MNFDARWRVFGVTCNRLTHAPYMVVCVCVCVCCAVQWWNDDEILIIHSRFSCALRVCACFIWWAYCYPIDDRWYMMGNKWLPKVDLQVATNLRLIYVNVSIANTGSGARARARYNWHFSIIHFLAFHELLKIKFELATKTWTTQIQMEIVVEAVCLSHFHFFCSHSLSLTSSLTKFDFLRQKYFRLILLLRF